MHGQTVIGGRNRYLTFAAVANKAERCCRGISIRARAWY
jgi:hypothetical protein